MSNVLFDHLKINSWEEFRDIVEKDIDKNMQIALDNKHMASVLKLMNEGKIKEALEKTQEYKLNTDILRFVNVELDNLQEEIDSLLVTYAVTIVKVNVYALLWNGEYKQALDIYYSLGTEDRKHFGSDYVSYFAYPHLGKDYIYFLPLII